MSQATTLADNRKPTESEWRAACALGREIIAAVDKRETVIAERGLDRAFSLGDANWATDAPNDYRTAYDIIRTLDWNEIRHLRFRCQIFSGFNLLHMKISQGMTSDFVVPENPKLDPEPPVGTLAYWRNISGAVPREHVFQPPNALGEIGWIDGDQFLNYETCVYQERITLLSIAGVLDRLAKLGRSPRILEIGGGHGALACALTEIFPQAHYTICDLPESLLFSGLYLSLAARRNVALWQDSTADIEQAAPATVELVPNYQFSNLVTANRKYDLAINVLSMSEMSVHQVKTYGHELRRLLGTDGLFFEQNQDNRHANLINAEDVLREVFPHGQLIRTGSLPITQGAAHLWGNRAPSELLPTQVLAPLDDTIPQRKSRRRWWRF
jgi:hypothetical protein